MFTLSANKNASEVKYKRFYKIHISLYFSRSYFGFSLQR